MACRTQSRSRDRRSGSGRGVTFNNGRASGGHEPGSAGILAGVLAGIFQIGTRRLEAGAPRMVHGGKLRTRGWSCKQLAIKQDAPADGGAEPAADRAEKSDTCFHPTDSLADKFR